jgi:hypothetical protein
MLFGRISTKFWTISSVHPKYLFFVQLFRGLFYYKGLQVGTRRVDFLVEHCICVELKALATLEDAQYCTDVWILGSIQ